MSKIIRSDRNDEKLTTENEAQAEAPRKLQLPPLRKFAVRRVNAENGEIETIIVIGHSIEPFGSDGVAVMEVKIRGENAITTLPRVFGHFEDLEELTTEALQIN